MRCFLAIELPQSTREVIAGFQQQVRASGMQASWLRPENFHLTLRFLGETDEKGLDALCAVIGAACSGQGPLQLCVQGTGAFPNPRRPAVIWAGFRALEGDLAGLQGRIETGVRGLGFAPDTKPFHPHVTVARIRDGRHAGACAGVLEACADLHADAFHAGHVALFKSQLHAGGAVYTRLQTFSLECDNG